MPKANSKFAQWLHVWRVPVGTHSRLEGHTDNYGEDSYNEMLSLKRANSVADAWAEGGEYSARKLDHSRTREKYPIASNDTAKGRAENRRVTVVISTP